MVNKRVSPNVVILSKFLNSNPALPVQGFRFGRKGLRLSLTLGPSTTQGFVGPQALHIRISIYIYICMYGGG